MSGDPTIGNAQRSLRIVSHCHTQAEFVAVFRRLCERSAIFIPTRSPEPRGAEFAFTITLTDGTPMIAGSGRVAESHINADNRWGRPGLRVEFTSIDDSSRGLVDFLSRQTSMAIEAPPDPVTPVRKPGLPPPVRGAAPVAWAGSDDDEKTEVTIDGAPDDLTRECMLFEETGHLMRAPEPTRENAVGQWWNEVQDPIAEPPQPESSAPASPVAAEASEKHSVVAPLRPPDPVPDAPLPAAAAVESAAPPPAAIAQPSGPPPRLAPPVIEPRSNKKLVLIAAGTMLASALVATLVLSGGDPEKASEEQVALADTVAPADDPSGEPTAAPATRDDPSPAAVDDSEPAATEPAAADTDDEEPEATEADGDEPDADDDEPDADDDEPDADDDEPDANDAADDSEKQVRAAAAPASGECELDVRTTPKDAAVLLAGTVLGKTPVTITVPCATRQLTIDRRRYTREVLEVSPRPGETVRVTARLARPKHQLRVTSKPSGAVVFIGKRRVGRTPARVTVPGFQKAKVRLTLPGFKPWSKDIYMKKEKMSVSARLKKKRR